MNNRAMNIAIILSLALLVGYENRKNEPDCATWPK